MLRILLLLLLGFIVWGIFRLFVRVSQFMNVFSQQTPREPKTLSAKLVECNFCHTFIPEDKAIYQKNVYYCCEEHANQK